MNELEQKAFFAHNHLALLDKELNRLFDWTDTTPTAEFYDLPYREEELQPLEWELLSDVRAKAAASHAAAFEQNAEAMFTLTHTLLIAIWANIQYFKPFENKYLNFEALPCGDFLIRGYELLTNPSKDYNDYIRTLLADDALATDDPVEQAALYYHIVTLLIMYPYRYQYYNLLSLCNKHSDRDWTVADIGKRLIAWIPEEHLAGFYTSWMEYIHRHFSSYYGAYQIPTDPRERYPLEPIIKKLAKKGCALAKADLPELDYAYGDYLMPSRSHALYDMMDEYGEADDSYSRELAYAYKYFKKAADAGHEKAKEALKQFRD